MKVKDLLKEINLRKKEYKDFLEWDIYTEQCTEGDKKYKRKKQKWEIIKDCEDWEYFKCEGFYTIIPERKVITINVNY